MAHIEPLDTDQHPELAPIMAVAAAAMGFVPNSTRTMAHMGQLPFVLSALFGTVMGGDAKAILAGLLQTLCQNKQMRTKPAARTVTAYCLLC